MVLAIGNNFLPWFLVVRFDVERTEHVGEQTGVDSQQAADGLWEVTRRLELNLNGVNEHNQELNLMKGNLHKLIECDFKLKSRKTHYLHYGQVLLPPQMLLYLGAHGCQHIVHVHNDMYERVDKTQQSSMTTCGKFG